MSSAEHVQNLLQSKFKWPKPRIVQKSKFANKIGEEISDENSIEKGSQQLIRQITEEEDILTNPQKACTNNHAGKSDFDENSKKSLLQSENFEEAVPQVNIVADDNEEGCTSP